MALVRVSPFGCTLNPFRKMTEVQSEMSRLFDGFFDGGVRAPGVERIWTPPVEVYETRDELVVKAELPGVSEKDIHLSIAGDMLTLRGERHRQEQTKQEDYYRAERWYGKFERSLPVPFPVQADKIHAGYRDGVLTVTLPKAEQVRPREVKIDVQ